MKTPNLPTEPISLLSFKLKQSTKEWSGEKNRENFAQIDIKVFIYGLVLRTVTEREGEPERRRRRRKKEKDNS